MERPLISTSTLSLFLCGDVMLGRGIDQILPHPGSARIHEQALHSATGYVSLAEQINGLIPRPVGFRYVWGDAIRELKKYSPQVRLINLETAITVQEIWEDKGINYRMHPANVPVLGFLPVDVCSLANNHTLDWGRDGLFETLRVLKEAGISFTGAGENREAARKPVIFNLTESQRVLIFAAATLSSGVPESWKATTEQSGVHLLEDFSEDAIENLRLLLEQYRKPGDIIIFSVHWGGNWGYEIPREHIHFAHRLIEEQIFDLIHGHSSHHFLGLEVYREKLIIYGCGDFLNDYEGIAGYEEFRGNLSLMYFPRLNPFTGQLEELHLEPLRIRRMSLQKAPRKDSLWVERTLNREGKGFGTSFTLQDDGSLKMSWRTENP